MNGTELLQKREHGGEPKEGGAKAQRRTEETPDEFDLHILMSASFFCKGGHCYILKEMLHIGLTLRQTMAF